MTIRTVKFYRDPPIRGSRWTPNEISIDLYELAAAFSREALTTGLQTDVMFNFFRSAFTRTRSGEPLVWSRDGLGAGRELRRSFSNILGRVFARWYLQRHEGVEALVSIEGKPFQIGGIRVTQDPRKHGDLPDWIGWDAQGLVIAEAKGSHARADWHSALSKHQLPSPIPGAIAQTDRVFVHIARRLIRYKGWAVASRWGTEYKGTKSWLIAADPAGKGESITPQEHESLRRLLIDTETNKLLEGMGHLKPVFEPVGLPEWRAAKALSNARATWLQAPKFGELSGLFALLTEFGRLPLRTTEDVELAMRLLQRTGDGFLVGISEETIRPPSGNDQRSFHHFGEAVRFNRGVLLNGFVLRRVRRQDRLRFEFPKIDQDRS